MLVTTIVGARPQFIKAAPVSRALADVGVTESLVHTGQHYDAEMSEVFFSQLGIREPAHHLGVGSGSHGLQTGRMLERIEALLIAERPSAVLVYGDTNSTLAGALAGSKLGVPVTHVEAGLRSFNRAMPEEINRVLTDHVSELLFAPTEVAVRNLASEGITGSCVQLVGDVMYDAALAFGERARSHSDVLGRLGLEQGQYVLATIHRAENTDDPERLQAILEALRIVAGTLRVLLPVHPRTRRALRSMPRPLHGVDIVDPVGYLDMVQLERSAAVIATDSGGVQKEAFFHAVPCVTFRTETEWTELVELGWNTVVPPGEPGSMAEAVLSAVGRCGRDAHPYGDGRAAERIAVGLEAAFG